MKLKRSSFHIAVVFALTTTFVPITGFADDADDADHADKKNAIIKLVRFIGYECGIHYFKNYVLRGDKKYRKKAIDCFTKAKKVIAHFRKNSTDKTETDALQAIEDVVDAYGSHVVDGIRADKIVNDGPAIDGIEALWKRYEWSALEQVEYALGYGGAIHRFKDYVLQHDDRSYYQQFMSYVFGGDNNSYYQIAIDKFTVAETALVPLKDMPATQKLLGIIGEYKAGLNTVKKMIADGNTAEEIDTAVKISGDSGISYKLKSVYSALFNKGLLDVADKLETCEIYTQKLNHPMVWYMPLNSRMGKRIEGIVDGKCLFNVDLYGGVEMKCRLSSVEERKMAAQYYRAMATAKKISFQIGQTTFDGKEFSNPLKDCDYD